MVGRQLRAVFKLDVTELYEVLTYGSLLKTNKSAYLDDACKALGARSVIVGAGYIEDDSMAATRAKSILPKRSSPTCYLTIAVGPETTRYLIAPSTILAGKPVTKGFLRSWQTDYFPDAPDTAVILSHIDPRDVISVDTTEVSFIRDLVCMKTSRSWRERLKRRFHTWL